METKSSINVVFHRVLEDSKLANSPYDLSQEFILSIVYGALAIISNSGSQLKIFFDDAYASHFAISLDLKSKHGLEIVLGIITEDIGGDGFLTLEQITDLYRKGIIVASHSMTHAALGKYKDGRVMDSPTDGVYHSMPRGKESVLTENEIMYQVVESLKYFEKRGIFVSDFIYPYGIYNDQIKNIVSQAGYLKAYSCDFAIQKRESDTFSIPRLVIDDSLSTDEWVDKIGNLIRQY